MAHKYVEVTIRIPYVEGELLRNKPATRESSEKVSEHIKNWYVESVNICDHHDQGVLIIGKKDRREPVISLDEIVCTLSKLHVVGTNLVNRTEGAAEAIAMLTKSDQN